MGLAMQVVSGRVTNPGATLTALTLNTGDTLAVRSFPFESACLLEQAWAQEATIGVLRIRSPRLHDVAQAMRLRVTASALPLLPDEVVQPLFPSDTLTVELSGGGAETDVAAMLLLYADLPGIEARLATWEEIEPRILNIMGAEQTITTGATVGDYGGSQAVNADFDNFRRGTDYALLGYLTDVAVGVVGITGADTGNLRVGGPGPLRPDLTARWYVNLARVTGRPHIPILNADNVAGTTIDLVHTAAATAVNVTLILAELGR